MSDDQLWRMRLIIMVVLSIAAIASGIMALVTPNYELLLAIPVFLLLIMLIAGADSGGEDSDPCNGPGAE